MPDYKKGRIYVVRCKLDDSLIYVGSTTSPLSSRFSNHKRDKGCSLYKYVQRHFDGDWSDWYIELYTEHQCENVEQLNKREGEIQREIATINKNKAGKTNKERYIDNIDSIKQYYIDHKDKIRQYYIDNRERKIEYQKQYNKYKNNLCKV